MPCDLCAKHLATLSFKGVIDNQTVKLHLCAACAKKKGMIAPLGASVLSLGDVVSALSATLSGGRTPVPAACNQCGLTYAEFQRTSQLGCGLCYKLFAPVLGPLLQRIQGSTQHIGKLAQTGMQRQSLMQMLAQKKLELQEAVKEEAYERAASLRDQIRSIEDRLTQHPAEQGQKSA